ncbi:siroheme synthase CysG [uncultured Algimonas sp.]|uniref:siroheme synthase CysG n=1 Tax=uncultured Algimonas sp. TaxID=1547920 RepID=UPI00262F5183|nr:siroheme synthase CysG [uncultured Algimonas sp.]
MRYLPIHIDLKDKTVLVFGDGPAAEAKLRTLMKTDARLVAVADTPSTEMALWAREGHIEISADADLATATLVYAATEDETENLRIAGRARALRIPVNAADQPAGCDFITPAIVDRTPVAISIGTEGTAPGLARALKSDLEARLPSDLGQTSRHIKALRDTLKVEEPDIAKRQAVWADVLGAGLNDLTSLNADAVSERYDAVRAGSASGQGHVHIVGAGPGDPDLLTVGALRAMHSADVVVYDRLVSEPVLSLCRREAEFVYVGKQAGEASTRQDEINRILVEKAHEGYRVVRLKSGDPLVFGRAEEEFAALDAARIGFTIHPGITAAAAAAASIRHSLTVRGENTAAVLATGHDENGFAELDWASLAEPGARATIYMGLRAARFIQGRLMLHGARPTTPVAVVENASRPDEVVLQTTLGDLPDDLVTHGISGPAVLMIGYARRAAQAHLKAAS